MVLGFHSAKRIDGIKRHVVVATLSLLVAVLVPAASVLDRVAVPGCSPEPLPLPWFGHL